MAKFKQDEIIGYCIDNETICFDCITKEERNDLTQDQILTEEEAAKDDDIIFCDRCEKRIN